MAKMGYGSVISRVGAHINAFWNTKEANGGKAYYYQRNKLSNWFEKFKFDRSWTGDSEADQRAILNGHNSFFND